MPDLNLQKQAQDSFNELTLFYLQSSKNRNVSYCFPDLNKKRDAKEFFSFFFTLIDPETKFNGLELLRQCLKINLQGMINPLCYILMNANAISLVKWQAADEHNLSLLHYVLYALPFMKGTDPQLKIKIPHEPIQNILIQSISNANLGGLLLLKHYAESLPQGTFAKQAKIERKTSTYKRYINNCVDIVFQELLGLLNNSIITQQITKVFANHSNPQAQVNESTWISFIKIFSYKHFPLYIKWLNKEYALNNTFAPLFELLNKQERKVLLAAALTKGAHNDNYAPDELSYNKLIANLLMQFSIQELSLKEVIMSCYDILNLQPGYPFFITDYYSNSASHVIDCTVNPLSICFKVINEYKLPQGSTWLQADGNQVYELILIDSNITNMAKIFIFSALLDYFDTQMDLVQKNSFQIILVKLANSFRRSLRHPLSVLGHTDFSKRFNEITISPEADIPNLCLKTQAQYALTKLSSFYLQSSHDKKTHYHFPPVLNTNNARQFFHLFWGCIDHETHLNGLELFQLCLQINPRRMLYPLRYILVNMDAISLEQWHAADEQGLSLLHYTITAALSMQHYDLPALPFSPLQGILEQSTSNKNLNVLLILKYYADSLFNKPILPNNIPISAPTLYEQSIFRKLLELYYDLITPQNLILFFTERPNREFHEDQERELCTKEYNPWISFIIAFCFNHFALYIKWLDEQYAINNSFAPLFELLNQQEKQILLATVLKQGVNGNFAPYESIYYELIARLLAEFSAQDLSLKDAIILSYNIQHWPLGDFLKAEDSYYPILELEASNPLSICLKVIHLYQLSQGNYWLLAEENQVHELINLFINAHAGKKTFIFFSLLDYFNALTDPYQKNSIQHVLGQLSDLLHSDKMYTHVACRNQNHLVKIITSFCSTSKKPPQKSTNTKPKASISSSPPQNHPAFSEPPQREFISMNYLFNETEQYPEQDVTLQSSIDPSSEIQDTHIPNEMFGIEIPSAEPTASSSQEPQTLIHPTAGVQYKYIGRNLRSLRIPQYPITQITHQHQHQIKFERLCNLGPNNKPSLTMSISELGLTAEFFTQESNPITTADKVTFICAGRKDNAFLPPVTFGERVVVVLTESEFTALNTFPAQYDALVIKNILCSNQALAAGTITSRRLAIILFAAQTNLATFLMLDDNIREVQYSASNANSSLFDFLNQKKETAACVSIATQSNKERRPEELGSKLFLIHLHKIREKLNNDQLLYLLLPEARYNTSWGEDYYLQLMLHHLFQSEYPGYSIVSQKEASLLRSHTHRNAFRAATNKLAEPLNELSEEYANQLSEPHIDWVNQSIRLFNTIIQSNIDRYQQQLVRLAKADLFSYHAKLNHMEVDATSDMSYLPEHEDSFQQRWQQVATKVQFDDQFLRPYQQQAIQAVLNMNAPNGQLHMATGTGKTRVQIDLARMAYHAALNDECIIIVTPFIQLVEQFYESFCHYNELSSSTTFNLCIPKQHIIKVSSDSNSCSVAHLLYNETIKQQKSILIFCEESFTSLLKQSPEFLGRCVLLLLDEYHDYAAQQVPRIKELSGQYDLEILTLGSTATPPLQYKLPTLFSYTLGQGISEGILAPLMADTLGLLYSQQNVDSLINHLPELLQKIIHPGFKEKTSLQETRGVIYFASTQQCETAKQRLVDQGYTCYAIHSKNPKHEQELKTFMQSNQPGILLAVNMIGIGFDDPSLSWIILAVERQKDNLLRLEQMMGRVVRKQGDTKIGYILGFNRIINEAIKPLLIDVSIAPSRINPDYYQQEINLGDVIQFKTSSPPSSKKRVGGSLLTWLGTENKQIHRQNNNIPHQELIQSNDDDEPCDNISSLQAPR